MFSSGAADPYELPDSFASYSRLTVGRTQTTPRITNGESTAVLLVLGQSNSSNSGDTLYTPSSAKVENLNVFNGGVYVAKDPMLGCAIQGVGGSWMGRLGDKLITAGIFQRVIFVPIGSLGTQIINWAPGGFYHQMVQIAAKRMSAVGLTATAVLWQQGEADGTAGTTQANYVSRLQSLITAAATYGITGPWFLAQSTYISGASNATIRAALASMLNGSSIYAGADTDTLTGLTNRQADLTHFTAVGDDAAAALWKTAIDVVF